MRQHTRFQAAAAKAVVVKFREGEFAMKMLLTGNEAIARGAFEAGVKYASAYPGTPSTEILENIGGYKDEIWAEWAPNEKVALEAAIGAAMAGGRSLAAMKHVGVNVAADPLFTYAYTGVNAGTVLVTADEPGQHSSQNEQDNRNYAKFAKIPLLEPADSQEAKDMTKAAFAISEEFDTPVLLRVTTRVCHSKGIVTCGEREEAPAREYVKNARKYMPVPAHSRLLRAKVEERMQKLRAFAETTPLNYIEWNGAEAGVIASGICYLYAKEVFGDSVSYLKLGFTHPLPDEKIKEFCSKVGKVYVLEENDPIIEERVRMLGFDCLGKNIFPAFGELLPEVIRRAAFGAGLPTVAFDEGKVVPRPPMLCAGCPHRGVFYELGRRKNLMISGDIGCYSLGFAEPYNAMDSGICMGASISVAHGAQRIFAMKGAPQRAVAVIGDSTFFHTGVNSLLDVTYNGSNTVTLILDNRITGMTGHQDNPGSGRTLQGRKAVLVDIEKLVQACGVEHVRTINPNDLKAVKEALDWALGLDEPAVIITRWPCVLKKLSPLDKEEFKDAFAGRCAVDDAKCIGCGACVRTGCPAVIIDKAAKKARISAEMCVGCGVCLQVCPVKAISKEEA